MEYTPQNPSLELLFPSELGYEKIAREAVASFARRLGFEQERIEDLKTALCEACVNAIEHGNQSRASLQVSIRCICDDQCLLVEVLDQGVKRFQECGTPAAIDHKLHGLAPLRGMGLMMIAQLVDSAGFSEGPDGGNRFWLALARPGGPARMHPEVGGKPPAVLPYSGGPCTFPSS